MHNEFQHESVRVRAPRKCDASNYETKQLVICSSVKMAVDNRQQHGRRAGKRGEIEGKSEEQRQFSAKRTSSRHAEYYGNL